MHHLNPLSLVVLEQGASWPGWHTACLKPPASIVIAPGRNEAAEDFAKRVAARVAHLDQELVKQGAHLRFAVLATRPQEADEPGARATLAELLARAAAKHSASVVVTADAEADAVERRSLLQLVGTLCERLGSAVPVSIGFGGSSEHTGVRRVERRPLVASVA